MKTICLYYSRSNLTRSIARRLSELLGADLSEYTDGVNRRGVLGYLRSCVDSFRKPPATGNRMGARPVQKAGSPLYILSTPFLSKMD